MDVYRNPNPENKVIYKNGLGQKQVADLMGINSKFLCNVACGKRNMSKFMFNELRKYIENAEIFELVKKEDKKNENR